MVRSKISKHGRVSTENARKTPHMKAAIEGHKGIHRFQLDKSSVVSRCAVYVAATPERDVLRPVSDAVRRQHPPAGYVIADRGSSRSILVAGPMRISRKAKHP